MKAQTQNSLAVAMLAAGAFAKYRSGKTGDLGKDVIYATAGAGLIVGGLILLVTAKKK